MLTLPGESFNIPRGSSILSQSAESRFHISLQRIGQARATRDWKEMELRERENLIGKEGRAERVRTGYN